MSLLKYKITPYLTKKKAFVFGRFCIRDKTYSNLKHQTCSMLKCEVNLESDSKKYVKSQLKIRVLTPKSSELPTNVISYFMKVKL